MTDLTIANLKGGVGKTTSAVLLSLGLAETGRTLLVDTDPNASALKWATMAADLWPWERLTVVSWTDPRSLGRQITAVRADYDHLVIDVPPQQDRSARSSRVASAILDAALTTTGHLIVPTSTSAMDLSEISDTFDIAAAVDARRVVLASVLLVSVRLSTRSATLARELLAEHGYPVMRAVIPLSEDIAQALGTVPPLRGRPFGAYADALTEIRADHDNTERP